MENMPVIANLITTYDISPSTFIDLLFQHGVDKVYFYGVASRKVNSDFIAHIPKLDRTFGLPNKYADIYNPVNMIEQACENLAHVDLNYDLYMRLLNEKYNTSTSDDNKKVISRIIGLFKPYNKIMIPILDTSAIQTEIINKRIKEKLYDLESFSKSIKELSQYKIYKGNSANLGTVKNAANFNKKIKERKEILKELIVTASTISKPLGALLKVLSIPVFFLDERSREKNDFNPLLINMEHYHKKASLSALDRIIIK